MKHAIKYIIGIGFLIFAPIMASCAAGPAPTGQVLFLDSAQTEQTLAADEIISFYVTFSQEAAESVEIEVSLETLAGADWKAALCYADQCFIHDGSKKLVHAMVSGEETEFEIKIFVPAEAQAGERKTVRMGAWIKGQTRQKATIDLAGYLPEP